ncbi:MAG: cytochrome C [Hyphomicrobiaceae bacterium]|nr:cytochrome C [Hyphomicrobiaceae bacterium]
MSVAKIRPCHLAMLALAASFALVAPARAAEPGDPLKGLAYAETNCSSCHAIERGRKRSPVSRATAFQVFADTPGVTRTAMLVFLSTPHPTMPNLVVTGGDADNVIAYILSLQR